MDLTRLKSHVGVALANELSLGTHATISARLTELGLPNEHPFLSKRERIEAATTDIADEIVPLVARGLLSSATLRAVDRNALQDALWANSGFPEVPRRTRRDIAAALEEVELYLDGAKFDRLLSDLWILDCDPSEAFLVAFANAPDRSLKAQIEKHVHRNPGDWAVVDLFDNLGAFDASDRRFGLFLEGLASPQVRPNEESQRRFVEVVNVPLKKQGLELRETGDDGGYPVFKLVSIQVSPRGKPKNLIFASPTKPDMRFRDAIDNDVEIVNGKDQVLVYDQAIGHEGLRWSDLQAWWMGGQGIDDEVHAKETLYRRLRSSLPDNSPPQRTLFEGFFRAFSHQVPQLPALLPEVWLHWDPKTIAVRGRDALLNSRMDFLMLLPSNVRVVIEVDGQHHYADVNGNASPQRYARMMAADRELRLTGYEVYRFGAFELRQSDANKVVESFFTSLFRRHGVRR